MKFRYFTQCGTLHNRNVIQIAVREADFLENKIQNTFESFLFDINENNLPGHSSEAATVNVL